MPCGICAVVNFNGLTQADLDSFTHTLVQSEKRGKDATGAALQSQDFIKAPTPASDYVKTNAYKHFLRKALGQKWIVGHTRHATQGDPKDNINNHPILIHPRNSLLVFNGIVSSNTIKEDESKTDTYIIVDAIKKHWVSGNLAESVKKAYKEFWGFSATIASTKNEIVFTASGNPLRRGSLPNGSKVFASDTDFFPEGTTDNEFFKPGTQLSYDEKGTSKIMQVEMAERPVVKFESDWDGGYFKTFEEGDEDNWDKLQTTIPAYYPTKTYEYKPIKVKESIPIVSERGRKFRRRKHRRIKPRKSRYGAHISRILKRTRGWEY